MNPFLQLITNQWWIMLAIFGILLLIQIVKSPRFKGWFGERVVQAAFKNLDPATYQVHHDLYLPRPDGKSTTQIDHVVVSPYGIFVIETKNYKGWIFGSEDQPQWTQQLHRHKSRFQNPLHQNDLHVRALAKVLHLDKDRFHSIVFFIGDCTFKTPHPENVMNRGLSTYIRTHQDMMLTPPELASTKALLAQLDQSTNRKQAAKEHLQGIEERRAKRATKNGRGDRLGRP